MSKASDHVWEYGHLNVCTLDGFFFLFYLLLHVRTLTCKHPSLRDAVGLILSFSFSSALGFYLKTKSLQKYKYVIYNWIFPTK